MEVSYPNEKLPVLFFFVSVFDAAWFLSQIKLKFYPKIDHVRYTYVLLVWLLISTYLAITRPETRLESWAWGGLFGLFAYGIFNLTELAINKNWTMYISIIDVCWGSINCSSSLLLSYMITSIENLWYIFVLLDVLVMIVLLMFTKVKCRIEDNLFVVTVS